MTEARAQGVLVIGAGIAGMQASLLLSKAGRRVHLIERSSVIGGLVARFEEVFTSMECATCLLAPIQQELLQDSKIELITLAEVESVARTATGFRIQVRSKARYVDAAACIGCGACYDNCPVSAPNEYELGLSERKAIFVPCAGALPNVPTIDPNLCLRFRGSECEECRRACGFEAIDFEQEDRLQEFDVGSIVVATGAGILDTGEESRFSHNAEKGIFDALEFERLNASNGPTSGRILLRDGSVPRSVVIVHCVGRDECGYCSSVCCMYSFKFGHHLKSKLPDAEIVHLVRDLCVPGKEGQRFAVEAASRGRMLRITDVEIRSDQDRPVVRYLLESGRTGEISADMVLLACPLIPSPGTGALAALLDLPTGPRGFIHTGEDAEPSSFGGDIVAIGCATGPKNIESSITEANAAVARILREGFPGE